MPSLHSNRSPRFERTDVRPIRVTDRDVQIIQHVFEHRFLHSRQIIDLLGEGHSRQHLLRRLRLLFHHRYLDRSRSLRSTRSCGRILPRGRKGCMRSDSGSRTCARCLPRPVVSEPKTSPTLPSTPSPTSARRHVAGRFFFSPRSPNVRGKYAYLRVAESCRRFGSSNRAIEVCATALQAKTAVVLLP